MLKRGLVLTLCMLMVFAFTTNFTYGELERVNPSREELEKRIEEVAQKRGIPSVILKSIARVESVFQQYKPDGSVFTGVSGSVGLMQIYNAYGWFDNERLKYDIDYNIEAGAEVLLKKWGEMAVNSPRTIGNMDPNILEHWYFALWAYNGMSSKNNPNAGLKKQTFQELIYMVAQNEYGQEITPIPNSALPGKGIPSKNTYYDTPTPVHYGDIIKYNVGDVVKVDMKQTWAIGKSPNGEYITNYPIGSSIEILEDPVLHNGHYWYRVRELESEKEGWVIGNIVSSTRELNSFKDVNDSWAKDYILTLRQKGIVTGSNGSFYPDNLITRLDLSVLLSRALNISNDNDEFESMETIDIEGIDDIEDIPNWAVEHVEAVYDSSIMDTNEEENKFEPDEYVTLEDMAIISARVLGISEEDFTFEQDSLGGVSSEGVNSIIFLHKRGLFKDIKNFDMYNEYITRAEASKRMVEILNILENEGTQ